MQTAQCDLRATRSPSPPSSWLPPASSLSPRPSSLPPSPSASDFRCVETRCQHWPGRGPLCRSHLGVLLERALGKEERAVVLPRYGTVPASFRCGRAVDGGLLERTAAPPSAPPPGPGASFVESTSAPGAAPYATASPARFSMTAGSRWCPPACDLLSAGTLGSGCCCPLSNNLRRPR